MDVMIILEKFYNISDLKVLMKTFGRTELQAMPYLCEPFDVADIVIDSSTVKNFGKLPVDEYFKEFPLDLREYLLTGVLFYKNLLNHCGMMLHSSCIVVDGKAYLFTADSGTGKSTHTNLWLNLFGDRAYILNDDKPALRLVDGVWYAYGTPWSGKNDISVNTRIPVAGIACLDRGEKNEIERFTGVEAIQAIIKQVNRPRLIDYRIKLLALLDKLLTQVPVWKLRCNMDPEAAIVSYEAMSGQKFIKENFDES